MIAIQMGQFSLSFGGERYLSKMAEKQTPWKATLKRPSHEIFDVWFYALINCP
jgi:hypothetical protein